MISIRQINSLFIMLCCIGSVLIFSNHAGAFPCSPEPTDDVIQYGDTVTCAIDPIGDIDKFSFQGSIGDQVVVQGTRQSGGSGPCIQLFDPSGAIIETSCAPSARIDATLAQTGSHAILVTEWGNNATTNYALAIERIVPPSNSATSICPECTLEDEINPVGDMDLFFFQGSIGDTVVLRGTRQIGGSGPCMQLYDPNGTLIVTSCAPSAAINVTIAQTGPHEILVTEWGNNATMTYALSYQCIGTCPPVPPCLLPLGHLDYCLECGPCAEGEGDCDTDSECQSGLTCPQVPGTDTCMAAGCPHPVGHLDYCRDCGPCAEGQGDCDTDSECQSGLTCAQVPGTDTCEATGCPHPVGHLDYCRDCGPCAEGQGDCDADSECQSGLTCVQVPGTDTCVATGCPHPVGHLDFCRDCGPCAAEQGDCDNNSECQSGLNCVQVPGTDVCCPHPIGHLDYCRDCGPCAAGQGDCDNDGECQSGLTCAQVPGTDTCQ